MGYRLALAGALVVLVIAGVVAVGAMTRGSDVVGADARAARAHAAALRGGRIATVTRRKINRFRARHGRGKLRYSRSLTRSARRHARYMARNGFGHLSVIRASRSFRSVGELILRHRGGHPRPRTAVMGWAHSPPHRVILLSARYRAVGIGKVSIRAVTYWTAHVGRR